MSSFISRCLRGEVLATEIDDFIDAWHDGDSDAPLHTFLGMTRNEYGLWVADPEILPFIIIAHRDKKNIADVLEEAEMNRLPIAARSEGQDKIRELLAWLKRQGS